jgi:hypothetical protein
MTMNQKSITNQILTRELSLNSTLNYLFNISNMKKLFTYLLISSMVILSSCTNYDDQFDDLNSQLTTLKSQIEGFSSLSSGLTALQGTVASLQTAIASIPVTNVSGLATSANLTALDTALTALAAQVSGLTTSLANAATSAEVAALQTALTATQADLAELLASNNIYSTAVTINTPASLAFATSLGDKLTIINADVTVTQTSTMNATELAAVLAKMVSVTGFIKYTATGTSVVPTAGFTSLTGVANLTADVDGDISFPKLVSASDVLLTTNAKTTSVSFPALTSLTSLGGAAASDNVLNFTAATSFEMGLLSRYAAASLSVTIKSGLVNLDALQIFAVNGTSKEVTKLTINGATEISLDALTEGEIDADKVAKVDFPVWKGNTASVFAKAKTVVLPSIEGNASGANTYAIKTMFPTAESVHIIGAAKALSTTTTATPSVSSVAQNDLVTLILDGVLNVVNVTTATDLTSVTHTGTAVDVTYSGTAVTAMDLGYTSATAGATNATALNGGLTLVGNLELTSFTAAKVDDITSLTVTGNTVLATLSMAALNSVGTATAASVSISGNDLTVEKIQIKSASGDLPVVAASINSVDLGPLKDYITAAKAKVGTTGSIVITADTVTSKLNADGTAATVVPDDSKIANFGNAASRTSDSTGGTAKVDEFHFTKDEDYVFSVNGFNSTITAAGGSDIAYDLATWAGNSANAAGFSQAGVTVTTGSGAHSGGATLTALDTEVGAHTYSIAINGTIYSVTTAGASLTDAVTTALVSAINLGKDVATDKDFTIVNNNPGLSVTSSSKGSASAAFAIGTFKSNLGTSTALGAGVGTNTNATSVVTAMVQPTKTGYVRVAVNTAGLAAAALRVATFTGGATGSATQLVSNGGSAATTTTGDNENVVTAVDGTSQSNSASVTTNSLYLVAQLGS